MEGTIHPYYAIALAPSIAALVAISGRELWRGRRSIVVRTVLALMIAATGVWSFVLLGRDATWLPWLRWVVLIGPSAGRRAAGAVAARLRRLAIVGLLVGSLTALCGTAAYTVATAATPHTGSIPTSGPTGSAIGGSGGSAGGGSAVVGTAPAARAVPPRRARCRTTSPKRWRAGRSRPPSPRRWRAASYRPVRRRAALAVVGTGRRRPQ